MQRLSDPRAHAIGRLIRARLRALIVHVTFRNLPAPSLTSLVKPFSLRFLSLSMERWDCVVETAQREMARWMGLPHLGQAVRGSPFMDCVTSNRCRQWSQALVGSLAWYSYVGMDVSPVGRHGCSFTSTRLPSIVTHRRPGCPGGGRLARRRRARCP